MRSEGRTFLGAIVIFAIVVGACGGAAPVRSPTRTTRTNERLDALVAAAREEGELTLSWTPGFLDVRDEFDAYREGFNKLYGLDLRVRFVPGASAADSAPNAIQELTAGRAASTDVFLGNETQIVALAKAGALATEQWSSWAPNVTSLKLVAPGGIAIAVQSRIPGITYSQRLVGADAPRSLADLLRPQYRGRVATSSDAAMFDRLASPDVWGLVRTMDYAKKLAPQLGGSVECGDETRIVSGEFDVFAFDCGSARVAQLKADGALIGWSVPADAAFVRYLYMGVPKNAEHPSAAKLWINFMVGREAQDVMYRYEYADDHPIAGSRTFAEIDRATKAGVKFFELTVESLQAEEARGVKSAASQIQTVLRVPLRR